MKFTYAKATLQFFFNGITEIYSEGSHPRRAEYDEKWRWKVAPLKSNFMWSIFVLRNDSAEFGKGSHASPQGSGDVENAGGIHFP